ncbi:MAG: S-layer homology domain-containing protein [Acidaminococcaceae bacterium]|nr:S-layer homology domain-containing protein [Acidaminococcaceae bacterium]
MKKSLVLAMAMAMGVTASAYAANPFSDVPAGHWAYDSIAQLSAAGVVDGYGATFGGDKLMTRYEMAQIVAKAMAKGANCDKLAAEFADELDALGVRVAKLEKKVDNVKITGNIRYSYADNIGGKGADHKKKNGANQYNRFRTRLFVNGTINNNWKYTGMLENDRMLNNRTVWNKTTAKYEKQRDQDDVKLKRAFLNGRIGGLKVEAGRCYFVQGDMMDGNADGLKVGYKVGKVGLTGWAFKNAETGNTFKSDTRDSDRVYMAKVDSKFGKLDAFVQYWKFDTSSKTSPFKDADGVQHTLASDIFEVGLAYPVAKDLTLSGQYYNGKSDTLKKAEKFGAKGDKNGYEFSLKYRGAKAAKPGTWGAWVTYADRPASTYFKPTMFNTYAYNDNDGWLTNDGYKGFEVGANYTFAKNIVGEVRYFALEGRDNGSKHGGKDNKAKRETLWAHVVFTF